MKDHKYEGKGNIHIWITKILAFIHGFNPIKLDAIFVFVNRVENDLIISIVKTNEHCI